MISALQMGNTNKSVGTLTDKASDRIAETAREFEATFLSMLLKEMRNSSDEEGGMFAGDTGDVQGGLFDLFMSKHLADAGGFGLATSLVQQLRAAEPAHRLGNTHDATHANRPAHGSTAPLAPA